MIRISPPTGSRQHGPAPFASLRASPLPHMLPILRHLPPTPAPCFLLRFRLFSLHSLHVRRTSTPASRVQQHALYPTFSCTYAVLHVVPCFSCIVHVLYSIQIYCVFTTEPNSRILCLDTVFRRSWSCAHITSRLRAKSSRVRRGPSYAR